MSVTMIVADTETTGLVAPEAEILELGVTELDFDPATKATKIGRPRAYLFRPERGIPPEASAIHHLQMRDVERAPLCTPEHLKRALAGADFIVCHNLAFDQQWLTPEVTDPAKLICTLKAASRVWPEAPGHSNGVLRYWLAVADDPDLANPPHRAGPDSWVTAHILAELLKVETVANMVRWTREPRYLHVCPLGKFRGTPWPDVEHGFLQWITRTADLDPDVKHAARLELERRAGGPA